MLLESFAQSILKWLRVPPGASVIHSNQSMSSGVSIQDNDYVRAIIDITVDDICIGDHPLTIDHVSDNEGVQEKLQQIEDEFNTIIKDVARDLCTTGVSVWDISVNQGNLVLLPNLEDFEVYFTESKEIKVIQNGTELHCLVFLNYNKTSLELSTEDSYKFKVNPIPMQLRDAQKTVEGISNAETSIARYRANLRPIRFANVDIGAAQGDKQDEVVNAISSAINANSQSLNNNDSFTDFDDNLPVLPNRKGIGKVDITTDIPSADVKELADLDYFLKKLNLIMRFPASYMDFSSALSESAVSTLRGDIRYNKLCKAIQSKIKVTFEQYLNSSNFREVHPVVTLLTYPSSEDDDVISALGDYCELASSVEDFIMSSDDKVSRLHKLNLLQDLFTASTSSPMLQKWFDDYEQFIRNTPSPEGESSEVDDLLGTSGDIDDL
jgi:hypothetical protein